MFLAFRPRTARAVLAAFAASGLVLASTAGSADAAERDWPRHVTAAYKITFNGFDIGQFRFESRVSGREYTLTGDAEISALLGAVRWRGITRSTGIVAGDRVTPSTFGFDFASGSRNGTVRLGFRKGNVTSISANPPFPVAADEVPLERTHLAGVADPLSAVMMLTRSANGDPCAQKLPVFDGKQRFDLVLTPRGERVLPARRQAGDAAQPEVLRVCGVRYAPIAGYRPNGETEAMARNPNIEIAFRQVRGAGLFVPHDISIPTGVGPAVLTLERMDIRKSNSDQIAFVN
ncbi:MAG: DUF3108 domain-containing protein [Hyphomicrobiaceae bacterium]|nr:DUF3108 domain-containing protein [Hyphomicrobiaceae bacterium]